MARNWQKKAEIAKKTIKGIQNELKTLIVKHDELVNKCMQMEKEKVQIKKSTKSRMIFKKEMIDFLKKKKKDNLKEEIRQRKREKPANWNRHRIREKDSSLIYRTIWRRKKH